MAKEETPLFNFADPKQYGRIAKHLETLHRRAVEALAKTPDKPHVYRVEVTRVRSEDPMSARQLGYLWAVVYPYAAKGVRDTWGEGPEFDSVRAHEFFKKELLRRVVVNRTDHAVKGPDGRLVGSGEVVGEWTPHLGELDAADRVHYIDAVILYCAEWLGIEVPQPDPNWRNPAPELPAPPVNPTIAPYRTGRKLPPGRAKGPTAEDGEGEAEQDRRAERLAGTPERLDQ